MRKEWKKPEIKNLSLAETYSDGCLHEEEAKSEAATTTLFPVIIWGDGKLGCTYWDIKKHGCTNPWYGIKGVWWPCPQAKQDSVTNS